MPRASSTSEALLAALCGACVGAGAVAAPAVVATIGEHLDGLTAPLGAVGIYAVVWTLAAIVDDRGPDLRG